MSKRTIPALLHDLADHAQRVRDVYAACASRAAFLKDQTAQDAVLWNFVVLGEISARLGDPFHAEHPSIPWRGIIRHRNVLAHGYDIVDWELIADVIERDLPVLIREARDLLSRFGSPSASPHKETP